MTDGNSSALESFKAAVAANPNDVEALENLGWGYHTHDQSAEAIETFRKALALDPNHVDSHYGLGLALRHSGRFDEAIREFQKVLELIPTRIDDPARAMILSRQARQQIAHAEEDQRTAGVQS